MILDSSAVVAVFFQEPEYDGLLTKLAAAEWVGIGAPTLVECSIVLTARMKRKDRYFALETISPKLTCCWRR